MSRIEKKFLDFMQENIVYIGAFILFTISIFLRFTLFTYVSDDWTCFLSRWCASIRGGGGFSSLAADIGNYNYPYMFLLTALLKLPLSPIVATKLLSMIFDYVGAFAAMHLVVTLVRLAGGDEKKAWTRGGIVFFLAAFSPAVIMNSAMWAQCDFIYTSFLLFSVSYMLREKYTASFVLLGVALGFKLQAAFILPMYVIVYLYRKRFSILNFLLVPLVFEAVSLPVVIIRIKVRGIAAFLDPFLVYVTQAGYYDDLSMRMPNVPSLMRYGNFSTTFEQTTGAYFKWPYILMAIAVLGLMAVLILAKRWRIDGEGTVMLAMWSIYTCVMLMPAMHERYGFALSLLFLCLAVATHRFVPALALYSVIEVLSYFAFLFEYYLDTRMISCEMAVVNVLLYFYMTWQTISYFAHSTQQQPLPQEKPAAE